MIKVFHYPWRAVVKPVHWRLPVPPGAHISPALGAFALCGDGMIEEIPGPSKRERLGRDRVVVKDGGVLFYSAECVHQFQREEKDSFVRRLHFALTDAFIWLSAYLYRYRDETGRPLAERTLSEACEAFREYVGAEKDFAPESLIVDIARNVPCAIASIVSAPRMMLTREHTEVPLDKIQEMDVFSLVDLARRPGRTVAMKAGPKQRLTALTRRETADTAENRVVLDFISRSAAAARQYIDEMCARCPRWSDCLLHDPVVEAACPSERVKLVAGYCRLCAAWMRGREFAEVSRLAEPCIKPNYVLQQNIRYAKVWKYYLRLLKHEDVEDDVWRWLRGSWSDMVRMLFMMAWEDRLKPKAQLATSRRPFMIRAQNKKGRWFVSTPFEDALVFKAGRMFKTLYFVGVDDAVALAKDEGLRRFNADFFIVVAKSDGVLVSRPVWTFCRDVKCRSMFSAEKIAETVVSELDSSAVRGLCVFPSEGVVSASVDGAVCLGFNVFSPLFDDVLSQIERYVLEVMS